MTSIFSPSFPPTSTPPRSPFRRRRRETLLPPKTATDDCVTIVARLAAIFWIFAASGHCSARRCHCGVCVCCVRTLLYPSGASQSPPRERLSSFFSPLIIFPSLHFLKVFLLKRRRRERQFSAYSSSGQIEGTLGGGGEDI